MIISLSLLKARLVVAFDERIAARHASQAAAAALKTPEGLPDVSSFLMHIGVLTRLHRCIPRIDAHAEDAAACHKERTRRAGAHIDTAEDFLRAGNAPEWAATILAGGCLPSDAATLAAMIVDRKTRVATLSAAQA